MNRSILEDDRDNLPCPFNLSPIAWMIEAREKLRKRMDREEVEDSELLDIYDDICNGLDVMGVVR